MTLRPLGRSGLSTAPLAFGGNVFGWTADEQTSFTLLDAFVGEGFSLIDTADVYSAWAPGHKGGESETVIGNWLAARPGVRDKVLIATKTGMMNGLTAPEIETAAEASLMRLRTDRIDIYFSHKDYPETELDETLRAYEKLIAAGKVRCVGASNYSGARVREALATAGSAALPRYEVLQPEYNLMARGFETEDAPVAKDEGLGVITYFSLASGFLSGKYRSQDDVKGARSQAVGKYLNDKGFAVLAALDAVSKAHGATPAQIALAWVMAKPQVTAAIASATSLDQFKDLAAAARLTLSAEDMTALDTASA
ncbi:aldo/keto reductase [soil metagenome]